MNVLFAYDGSAGADAAIETAASLLAREAVNGVVLTVWEPLIVQALRAGRFGSPSASVPLDAAAEDAATRAHAQQIADHGAKLASEVGFDARPLSISDKHDIPRAILETAADLDVDLIVMGERGLTGIRSFIGSVSRRVVQDAHRPVLVIPAAGGGRTLGSPSVERAAAG